VFCLVPCLGLGFARWGGGIYCIGTHGVFVWALFETSDSWHVIYLYNLLSPIERRKVVNWMWKVRSSAKNANNALEAPITPVTRNTNNFSNQEQKITYSTRIYGTSTATNHTLSKTNKTLPKRHTVCVHVVMKHSNQNRLRQQFPGLSFRTAAQSTVNGKWAILMTVRPGLWVTAQPRNPRSHSAI
jgi:hypothetical protein